LKLSRRRREAACPACSAEIRSSK